MRILVTGAAGFVGQHVLRRLGEHEGVAAIRKPGTLPIGVLQHAVGDIGPETDWRPALDRIDAVIHLAGRAHMLRDTEADPLQAFRLVNRDGTLRLAEQAEAAGVRRFIFVSSIGVNGNGQGLSYSGHGYTGSDAPEPHDLYAVSKYEAEEGLRRMSKLEWVIVRPPLVHGAGAPGNMRSLLNLIWRRPPLPLGSARNRRSFIGADNLADVLVRCCEHESAAGHTLTICDDGEVSTADLVRLLAKGMKRPARLLPFPVKLAQAMARAAKKEKTFDSLFGSLVVDSRPAKSLLCWSPAIPLAEGLAQMAAAYRDERAR